MRGRIIRGIAGFYYVLTADGETYACRARGIFRKNGMKPLVGDEVEFSVTDPKDMEGSVDEILPRKSELLRPAVANVDQALLLFAVKSPDPNFQLMDRFLIQMKSRGLSVLICFNKTDLAEPSDIEALREYTAQTACRSLFLCAKTGEGIEEVLRELGGKTTALAGPSGAGKSTLINRLCPEAAMETGAVSAKTERGKHTTRHAELLTAGSDTFLVDTPGFSSLLLPEIKKEELRDYYPEFAPFEEECRFLRCSHVGEKDCGVKRALEKGLIHEERYRNYVMFYGELSKQN